MFVLTRYETKIFLMIVLFCCFVVLTPYPIDEYVVVREGVKKLEFLANMSAKL